MGINNDNFRSSCALDERCDPDFVYGYQGDTLKLSEWARLSHVQLEKLSVALEETDSIDSILDRQVFKVDGRWMYYLSAATRLGVSRKVAEQLHNEGKLAWEIAQPTVERLFEYAGENLSLDDVCEITHLSGYEIKRRIAAGWSTDRIMTERIQPKESVFAGEMDIGDVRMSIGNWMNALKVSVDDLAAYIPCEGLNANWTRKTAWEALLSVVRERCRTRDMDCDYVVDRLGKGWTLTQVFDGRFDRLPGNYRSLFVQVDGKRCRLGYWIGAGKTCAEGLRVALRDENGKIDWQVEKVCGFIQDLIHRNESRRAEAAKIKWQGQQLTQREWSEKTHLPESVIQARVRQNWHVEDVLNIPYPCGRVVVVAGRRYTEETYREKFGESIGDMLRRQEAERVEKKRQLELREQEEARRRKEELERRLSKKYDECLERRVKMAGVEYTVREWMEILGIPKGAFKGEMRFLSMHYGSLWCSKMRGMLRAKSMVATNKELLARVAKRN